MSGFPLARVKKQQRIKLASQKGIGSSYLSGLLLGRMYLCA
jgi:hypothetical protein